MRMDEKPLHGNWGTDGPEWLFSHVTTLKRNFYQENHHLEIECFFHCKNPLWIFALFFFLFKLRLLEKAVFQKEKKGNFWELFIWGGKKVERPLG